MSRQPLVSCFLVLKLTSFGILRQCTQHSQKEVFAKIAETGSFTAAAEALGISRQMVRTHTPWLGA
jgi:molybdenum-dependent DNA-binding transcriptional regulator ModE